MKGCSLPKPLLYWCTSQRRHSVIAAPPSTRDWSSPSPVNESTRTRDCLLQHALPMWQHVLMCLAKRPQPPLNYLLGLPCYVPWHKSPFFLPGILSCQIKKPDAMSGSVLLQSSPHTQDSKTRTTRCILQFYIYNWTFIIFKISTRFITINYTLLSKYIKR